MLKKMLINKKKNNPDLIFKNLTDSPPESRLTKYTFMEAAPDGFIIFDAHMNIIKINPSAMAVLGVDQSVIGMNAIEVSSDLKEFGRYDQYMEVIRSGTPLILDNLTFTRKLGAIHLTVKAFKVGSGFGIIISDITKLKKAEKKARQSNNESTLKNRIADILLSVEGPQMYADVLSIVLNELKSEYGYFGFINDGGDLVCPSVTIGIWEKCAASGNSIVFKCKSWGGLWRKSLVEKRLIVSNRPQNPLVGHVLIKNCIVSPIIFNGELIGQIAIANKASDYSENDIATVKVVSSYIARFLKKRLDKDQKESLRIKAEKELNQYKHIVSSSSDMMAFLDKDFRYIAVNKAYLKAFGLSFNKLINKTAAEVFGQEFFDAVIRPNGERCLNGEEVNYQEWLSFPAYGKCYMDITYYPHISKNSEVDGFIVNGRNITKKKRSLTVAERLNNLNEELISAARLDEKLKLITEGIVAIFKADFARIWMIKAGDLCNSECQHAKVLEGKHVCKHRDCCLHLVSSSGRYTHLDGEHRRVPFGCYKIGRIAAGSEPKFLTNDVANDSRVHNHSWAKKHNLVSFAGYRLLAADGKVIGVLALFSTRKISFEEYTQIENLASVTAQVIHAAKADEALRESEEKLRAIFNASPLAIVLIHHSGQVLDSNDEYAVRLKMRRDQIIGKVIWKLLPPSVRVRRRMLIETVFETGTPIFDEDERDGIWEEFRICPAIKDESGNVEAVVVEYNNITARKKAEQALEEEKNKLEMSLAKVKKLSGLLPICGICKKIRDDKGYWNQIEAYIAVNSEAEFSHSICQDCARKHYPDLNLGDDT
jgi:PAS domain S-box-containing protein